ncbi:MAG: class I SAM-dependent methyltransferase [Sulfuricurvum sp.]|nr:class I SAM-dependent methyltransferase [Sulfuricurvum sp.]
MNTPNHFDSIADVFNRIWYFSDNYKDFVLEHILHDLSLNSEDILVDIGGGTGTFTSRIMEKSLLQKAYCIEPSSPMCIEAAKLGNITALCLDAHAFLTTETPFNKLLLKEVIHHIDNRETFWHDIYNRLPIGGKLLIITRPQNIDFPFFQSAKTAFSKNQPPHEIFESELKNCGFFVETKYQNHTFTLPKESWYEMLRYRFMSDLCIFSDEEIEEGIQEIDNYYYEDILEIVDNLIFMSAEKKE